MTTTIEKDRRDELIAAFHRQADFCAKRGATFTAQMVAAAGDLLEGNHASFWSLIERFDGDPHKGALALRVAGALHGLVLQERADVLERLYATPEVIPDLTTLKKAIAALLDAEHALFASYVASAPQTNEINRAAVLLFGFSEVAKMREQPLAIFEVGASAGMLLCWDQFRYDFGAFQWGTGDPTISTEIRGTINTSLKPEISVSHRQGCDLNPLDLTDPDTILRMRSYIWPEDHGRRALFDRSIGTVKAIKPQLEKIDALSWLCTMLDARPVDRTNVFYHSVFAPYLSNEELAALEAMMNQAGQTATVEAPLAWLRFEPDIVDGSFEFFLDLQTWPGGERRRLLRAHPHGLWVEPLSGF